MPIDARSLTPAGWARHTSGGRWRMAPHLALLNRVLLEVAAGTISRLMVWMPPRHGKSELTSAKFPGWYLGLNPHHKVLLTSYEANFAAQWGARVRDDMATFGSAVYGLRVRDDTRARNAWRIAEHDGGMWTAGVGGALTGKGAHLLVVDDPVKDAEAANSETQRDAAWDWWQSTASTRIEPGGSAVVIQTRWHEDDLSGRILRASLEDPKAEQWMVLSLPAIAEEDEEWTLPGWDGWAWRRDRGEALWPERYNLESLDLIKRRSGPWWQPLFQQNPQPPTGGILKPGNIRRAEVVDGGWLLHRQGEPLWVKRENMRLFQTVDLATSERKTADWTVISTWGIVHATHDLVWLDCVRFRAEGPDLPDRAVQAYEAWRPAYIGVEGVAFQQSMVQMLRRGDPRAGRRPLPVRPLRPRKGEDKITRAQTTSAFVDGGQVYAVTDAPWWQDAASELRAFPKGAHDDMVDTLTYAGLELAGGGDRQMHAY